MPFSLLKMCLLGNASVAVGYSASYTSCTPLLTFGSPCLRPTREMWAQVDVRVTPGTHSSEDATNKQLNDKERVAAALENPNLCAAVNQSLGFYCRDR